MQKNGKVNKMAVGFNKQQVLFVCLSGESPHGGQIPKEGATWNSGPEAWGLLPEPPLTTLVGADWLFTFSEP